MKLKIGNWVIFKSFYYRTRYIGGKIIELEENRFKILCIESMDDSYGHECSPFIISPFYEQDLIKSTEEKVKMEQFLNKL